MTEQEKFDYLIDKGWYATENGKVISSTGKSVGRNRHGYLGISFRLNKKVYQVRNHRFIYYYFNKEIPEQIDHINRIRNDNRLENLRIVTNQENAFNTNAKGYCWDKSRKKWLSCITLNGKQINLGRFDTEQEARQAYLDAKKVYHIIENP
jgi:hypothetical protein